MDTGMTKIVFNGFISFTSLLTDARMVCQRNLRPQQELKNTEDVEELALAWARGEITAKQASHVLGFRVRSGNYLRTFAHAFKRLMLKGKIEVR